MISIHQNFRPKVLLGLIFEGSGLYCSVSHKLQPGATLDCSSIMNLCLTSYTPRCPPALHMLYLWCLPALYSEPQVLTYPIPGYF